MNILTRGLGHLTKLLTRGYGRETDVAGPSAKRTKEYKLEIYSKIQRESNFNLNITSRIKVIKEKVIKIYNSIAKTAENNIKIFSKIDNKKLIEMIEEL